MNDRQKQILARLKKAHAKEDHTVNSVSISKEMGITRQLISREILGLEAKGIIKKQAIYKVISAQ